MAIPAPSFRPQTEISAPVSGTAPSLCVDLDGTLIATDLLWESVLLLIRHQPVLILWLPIWLLRGKAHLKAQLASRVRPDASVLPYRADVLDYVREARSRGRTVVLATAADHQVAHEVAAHLGCFGAVIASDGARNMSETRKSAALVSRFGRGGFDYIGDSRADLPAWGAANAALLVDPSRWLLRRARSLARVQHVFATPRQLPMAIVRALRVHQWLKNALVFVPVVMAHQVLDSQRLIAATVTFVVFSLLASSVYITNDLLDLESDRQHPRKKGRPFAAGDLSITTGLALSAGLLCAGLVLGLLALPAAAVAATIAYAVVTAAYSLWLKRLVVADVIVLASLYVLRVVAGGMAADVPLSHWLLGFSMFVFLSLALMKRHCELTIWQRLGRTDVAGRGYQAGDREWIGSMGAASGYMSVVVLALYITSRDVEALYRWPTLLWPVCVAMLFWITRMWALAYRGTIDDDPVLVAIRDRTSYVLGASVAMLMVVAT
jgi:4-hydroxybenzoate polyprenyltransferase/phosphoserine phosphatase